MESSIDLTKPVPFPFAGDPIFVCIDVEHKEFTNRGAKPFTEFGFLVVDTAHIRGILPGDELASNWIVKIERYHITIKEHKNWKPSAFNLSTISERWRS